MLNTYDGVFEVATHCSEVQYVWRRLIVELPRLCVSLRHGGTIQGYQWS